MKVPERNCNHSTGVNEGSWGERHNIIQSIVYKLRGGASLVAQWLRICLPMQGTRVRAVVWEDPTCRGATEPVRHNH